jgi:poly-gamma-glutamate synthesis protein (capsule biosynthesis protein)
VKIGFACYNEFAKNGAALALDEIVKLEKKADVTVVYAHWGTEYEKNSSQKQRELAHRFVDNGADLIIGSHPHVVQEVEIYNGKEIYYSLGNFVFDQYFEDSTKHGLLVNAIIEPNGSVSTKQIDIEMSSNGKTNIKK